MADFIDDHFSFRIVDVAEIVMATFSILGALYLSLELDSSKYGYPVMLIGSLSSIYVGSVSKLKSLTVMGFYFTIINMVGVVNYILID